MKNLHFFKLLVLSILLISFTVRAQVVTPFTKIYQTTQKGGIVFLANSALGCAVNPPAGSIACAAGVAQVPPLGTYSDNNFNSVYIDIDGDATTFMSSSDSLNLPLCSGITKAYLFWGANGSASTTGYTSIKMKINSGAYQTVTASSSIINTAGYNTYHCYADVTPIIKTGGIRSRVTVANIPTGNLGSTNTFGSWNLVVVYNNDLLTMRQLTVFNGLANVSTSPASASVVDIPITGFTTPLTGPVTFEVGVYTHDGDRSLVGDQLKFNGGTGFVNILDLVNPSADVMNSTVSNNGVLTPFRIPNMNNTAGLDADIFAPDNTAKTYLGNAVNSATFEVTTISETYLTQMITTAIDVYEPDIRASVKVTDVNGGSVQPGDILEYRVKGLNIGSDPSVNTFITDTIEQNANYIPNSVKIVYGPNSSGTAKTDAAGDDQAEYNSVNRTIKLRIGTGANALIGGTVVNSVAGADSTVFTYSVMATNNCVKLSCDNIIDARAFIWGTGNVSGNTFNNGSNPGVFDINGCPIPGSTSSPINAAACVAPTASVNPVSVCTTGSFSLSATTNTEVTYAWSGPGSFTSAVQNPVITNASATNTGVYTVSLTAYHGCLQTATTSVAINNCPIAAPDASNTAINTPVSGNVGTNDINTSGATFTITTQPSNGTVTMNPATGNYTFTPSPTFTGVTTSTYQVCNGSPVVCVNTSLTFTVYPNVAAVANVFTATPTASVTGNLVTNDIGVVAGGVYSVSVTQPSASTGTLALNASTGQYTFFPNSTFSGITTTTYTLCNVGINPQQCSSTTITIVVAPFPVAVNDATTTVINTTVSGNASLNDTGVITGFYVITTPPATASGTISLDVNTGIYTFTPTTGFTGTAQATYQLCNAVAPPCSTANITFTVYPNLTAVANTVVATPTAAVTGSLLANDIGITAGAVYSVSVTQPATTTGTFVINSTTGQYTFNPNPAFAGTASTTYTVCNTSINPQQCSNTTIIINVDNTPVAINDATTTVINTPVTGNAATNDSGILTASFTVVTPPANGTMTMSPITGVYSFTPATGFTGVTTATYQVCNVTSPPCSTASISFTVYPTLTAVSNTISTTPSVIATGSLLANDIGITAGANYTVSVTQPASTTGTIVLNPATGQYTFNPNPSYTGSVTTNYTVCNTSVNPQQCSNTSITISVGNTPAAANDGTTTVINTPVSGDASANDSGVLTGSFTVVTPPANGTMTMNPGTGVYSFTPATGFTGVTTATYQLCNVTSPPCSTASISFTVYPTLTAVSNTISTTPSVATTGSLLANDIGITSGANYTVSVTQPATTTGTIVLNSVTGQYTFNPNPAFSGSVTTSYTVCNTSVNPQQCSNTSIFISVGNMPVAANDGTTTVINTPLSGDVSTNDSGVITGTFTLINPPANGTMTLNPATGAYSFTPATGFTGVTTATYQLCNILSPPCSTASISFTVYPVITAVANTIITTPTTAATGSFLTNDLGITAGGSYSVSVTQPSASTGTFIVNAATGQYTFTPNASFTGTTTASYTVCNIGVNPQQCSNTTISITVDNIPLAVNDATNTVINTPVTGTASANDTGTLTGNYVVSAQPAATSGTVSINATTGIYTFTPASGFTGTAQATYQLCNVLSPPCATANITFTVYPAIASASDVIATTPSVTATGTLLTNDTGITSGAVYSVSVTQPSSSTGTLDINPATGQYTFTPNPAFTGSASVSYTVCNTSVNPQQCSNTTILITVGNTAVAVNDATTTVINTPVTANAGINDSGVLSPTFTIVNPPTTGTLTINPTTGVYTFTPAAGFTGTSIATYQLCNILSPPCSTASITFSVYPNLVSVPDVISTTPSVTATGTLLGNDAGVVPGGNYSVTVTPLAPSQGTLTVNPVTGAYSFTPNITYTGTAVTSYTVCNTGVNPQICSSTTIMLNVVPAPLAVNDATNTVVNTIVTGTAATNDTGVFTGTFTVLTPPANGTLTLNAITGVYSFTPATGFTGVTTATYQLCNAIAVPCATASISFTVYPALFANNDNIVATPSVIATGTLLSNDNGVVPGGSYSVTVTPPLASTGTLVVDPLTGAYSFTPNTSFTGSASTTYTVCNLSVHPSVCSSATIILSSSALAVNDGTTTLIEVPVSGNASNNDLNATGGTYTVTGLPANGTMTMSTAGVYTFTPATGFTGITTATYQLCSGTPQACSNAIINFTVFPIITSSPDVINTTPSVTTTGTLTGNDPGATSTTTLGGTYSVSITPLDPATGTLVVDPATGTYSFIPNPSFTGSITTTYTICDTSVNPQQCSSSTITLNVVPAPVAANDATTTVSGIPVTGNLSGNDTGVLTATFSVVTPSPDGTVTVNPATGQYIFIPSPGFTGTTTAIYQLCNFASPPCATAAIVFTVYPAVVSNTSITFANTAVTGNASSGNTPNTGLTYGTPLVTGTPQGTLVILPDGTYTFTPAPAFTGTTSYIVPVCNTTVTPPVCANDTIFIHVIPALITETLTVVNGSGVTGNVLTNEPPAIQNATVSTIPLSGPAHGTFSITPAGNFTYTANDPNYTGYDTIRVTVCAGTACSTNTIIIAVYPHLVSNTSTTFINNPVSGNAATGNSPATGLVYGTSLVTGASHGTMVISPDGTYTFTPVTAFTGTTQYVVTVCNTTVTPPLCSNDTINIIVTPGLNPETVSVTIGSTVTGNVLSNDPVAGQNGTVNTTPAIGPHHGTITVTPNGNFTFTPTSPDYSGYDTVLVTICVGTVCTTNTINIIIYPSLGADTGTVLAGESTATGNVSGNDHGTGLTVTTATAPVKGTVVLNPNGTYVYTPATNVCGPDSFAYTACDISIPPLCRTAWVYIDVLCEDETPFVPEGISPNGDGVNDVLNVRGISKYTDNKITIFNRWGNIVFEGNALTDKWDGTTNKGVSVGDNKLPVGTYFYILELKSSDVKNKKGYIYLQR